MWVTVMTPFTAARLFEVGRAVEREDKKLNGAIKKIKQVGLGTSKTVGDRSHSVSARRP